MSEGEGRKDEKLQLVSSIDVSTVRSAPGDRLLRNIAVECDDGRRVPVNTVKALISRYIEASNGRVWENGGWRDNKIPWPEISDGENSVASRQLPDYKMLEGFDFTGGGQYWEVAPGKSRTFPGGLIIDSDGAELGIGFMVAGLRIAETYGYE